MKKKPTTNAIGILHRRYVKGNPDREAALETERVNAQVARIIYDMRTEAGLSQNQLAELVGTTQSVISRLEDADYHGHSLTMLNRVSYVLKKRLTIVVSDLEPKVRTQRDSRAPARSRKKASGNSG